MSYLYELIPKPATLGGSVAWVVIIDHVVGVILSSVDHDTMWAISYIDYPHTIWNRLWKMHGDPHTFPFLEDLTIDCLICLAHADCMPFDNDTLEELEYITDLACFDGSKICLLVPTSHIEIPSQSSPIY